MRVKRTPNCLAGCCHQERKGRPDEADWADYTDRSMTRYGSSWSRDFLGTTAGKGIGTRTNLYVPITKRSRHAVTRLRARRSDPANPPNPPHPVAPSFFLPARALQSCPRRDSSVVFILSCKGPLRTGLSHFLASPYSPQRARPRPDRRPSGARCSTGARSTAGAGSAMTASRPRIGRSRTAR
jgi:hypothetical protein